MNIGMGMGIGHSPRKGGGAAANLFANSAWDGDGLPYAWTAPGGTGTRTTAESTIDAEDNSIRFQATAQRPFIQFLGEAVETGEVLTFSFDVEAIGDLSTVKWAEIFTITGISFTVDWNGVTTTNDLISGLTVGTRAYARLTVVSGGTPSYRFGLGCANNTTGDVTFSRPSLKRGRSTTYTRTRLTEDGPFVVFLDFGQSNTRSGLTIDAEIDVSDPRVFQLTQKKSVALATEPLDHPVPVANAIGHSMTFARDYYLPQALPTGFNILIVPTGYDGTGFTDNSWNPGDTEYEAAVLRTNVAMACYPGNVFAGFLWDAGETDADSGQLQAPHESALDAMISAVRGDVTGASDAPVIVGGLAPTWVAADGGRQPVQDAIEATPTRVVNAGYAASTDLTTHDGIHYDAASQRIFAGRYYAAYAAVRNRITNSLWVGGTTPTGWSAAGGTGTRTAVASIIDSRDTAIRYVASNQRPFLQQSVAVVSGEVWTLTFDIEAIGDITGLTWGRLMSTAGVAYSVGDFNGNIGADVIAGLAVGDRVYARFTFSASGTAAFRVGLGAASNATGDITLSRPLLALGNAVAYFPRD